MTEDLETTHEAAKRHGLDQNNVSKRAVYAEEHYPGEWPARRMHRGRPYFAAPAWWWDSLITGGLRVHPKTGNQFTTRIDQEARDELAALARLDGASVSQPVQWRPRSTGQAILCPHCLSFGKQNKLMRDAEDPDALTCWVCSRQYRTRVQTDVKSRRAG